MHMTFLGRYRPSTTFHEAACLPPPPHSCIESAAWHCLYRRTTPALGTDTPVSRHVTCACTVAKPAKHTYATQLPSFCARPLPTTALQPGSMTSSSKRPAEGRRQRGGGAQHILYWLSSLLARKKARKRKPLGPSWKRRGGMWGEMNKREYFSRQERDAFSKYAGGGFPQDPVFFFPGQLPLPPSPSLRPSRPVPSSSGPLRPVFF